MSSWMRQIIQYAIFSVSAFILAMPLCLPVEPTATLLEGEPSAATVEAWVVRVFTNGLSYTTSVMKDGTVRESSVGVQEVELTRLRHFGNAAIPLIASHLKSGNIRERKLAVMLLGNQGGEAIIQPLRAALSDPVGEIRLMAVYSLSTAPRELAIQVLSRVAERDPDCVVKQAARDFIASSK